jgi:hypothetical protein
MAHPPELQRPTLASQKGAAAVQSALDVQATQV